MMITEGGAANFAENLRSLCGTQRSISDVCRAMGISRQQFNKYLSGRHLPSRQNVGIIAEYFMLSPDDLVIPPKLFVEKIRKFPGKTLKFLGDSARFAHFAEIVQKERANTLSFCGVYERYHFSSIYSGHVLRSIVIVNDCGGLICHGYVERFPGADLPRKAETVFKYHGFTSMIAGRLFMIDFEAERDNEMTTTILVPRMRGSSPLLFGLTMGVAATLAREPFSTRVALRRVSAGTLKVAHLRVATAWKAEDATIPLDIRRYLDSEHLISRAADSG